ncbi:DNA-3-methyladenine glycosylase I [Flavobacteriaceae bacterium]|nr:DNA-3-methyladenine glycosylase I [Flavobacteriaceae bacterium]
MVKKKCDWCLGDPLYENYHDNEWGVPVYDDQKLFEFLTLEGFQAGLSWITILRKRKNFSAAFDGFDYNKVARYSKQKKNELLNDKGIVRNRLKIDAAVSNAQAYIGIQKRYGSFSQFIWGFTAGKPLVNTFKSLDEVPPFTPLAEKISKVLKNEGFKFVGPTIIYSHMQATGMVNDHLVDCFRHREIESTF